MWVLQASARGSLTRSGADQRAVAFARDLLKMADVALSVRGADKVPGDRPFVYMSNHQSMFDVPVLWARLPAETLRFVGKTELFRTPIWGRAMRAGEMIEVDRSNRDQAIESLGRGAQLIRSGVSVWIAPEGHRSDTGQLGPLKKGGFHLAKNAGVDIVPVAINGTINVLPPHQLKLRHGQQVEMILGEPIAVSERTIPELVAELESFFAANVDQNIRISG